MIVAVLRELFEFNAWANRRILAALADLPSEAYQRDLQSSHGGIEGTLRHIVWAEHLWLTRWLENPAPAVAQGADLPSLAAVRDRWEEVEAERRRFLGRLTDSELDRTLTIRPTSGGQYVHTLRQTLMHAVDHSSYHRGQIVTLLRQLGVRPPSTGLVLFYRERSTGTNLLNF